MYDWMPDPPRAWRCAEKMKEKKAPGPDGITNEMLKHLGPGAKRTLLRIYNQSWSTGSEPTIWNEDVIGPFPIKGKDKRDSSSYHLISLLNCVGKLPERIINKRLTWHLESNSVLASTQTRYRQFRSTEDQVAQRLNLQQNSKSEVRWDDQQTSQIERGCSPRWSIIACSLPDLHEWHHKHSVKTCVRHPACIWLCSAVRRRTYHHSCPPHPEHHQRGVQIDWELGTTAQHIQHGQHTLHTVHRKGEGLTIIKQPASSTGWNANVSWSNTRYTLDVETTLWSSWSQGYQKTGQHEETYRNHLAVQLWHPETGLHRL